MSLACGVQLLQLTHVGRFHQAFVIVQLSLATLAQKMQVDRIKQNLRMGA